MPWRLVVGFKGDRGGQKRRGAVLVEGGRPGGTHPCPHQHPCPPPHHHPCPHQHPCPPPHHHPFPPHPHPRPPHLLPL